MPVKCKLFSDTVVIGKRPTGMKLTMRRMMTLLALLLIWLPGLSQANVEAGKPERVALVVGNADYALMPLDNPINDASAMSMVLKEAGFDVVTVLDADLAGMQNAMLQFAAKLTPRSTALVYYAGHGIQSNGRNYLLPVDVRMESESALRFEALSLDAILEELDLSGARTKLVILDACRNNPFERKTRGGSRGLAAVDAARGTLIAYATAPGSTAADGSGENGLYTASLIKAMRQPGLKVEEVFKQTRIEVSDASSGAQVPWESSSLTGDLIFIGAAGDVTLQVSQPDTRPSADRDAIFWQSIDGSTDPRMFQAYLDQFPEGTFRALAELRLAVLSEEIMAEDEPASRVLDAAEAAVGSGDEDTCADLSGTWNNQATGEAICVPPTLSFTATGTDAYAVTGKACGVTLNGQATRDGNVLELGWKMASCSGVTTYTFADGCRFGRGPIETRKSLLCKDLDNEGIISFRSRETDRELSADSETTQSDGYRVKDR